MCYRSIRRPNGGQLDPEKGVILVRKPANINSILADGMLNILVRKPANINSILTDGKLSILVRKPTNINSILTDGKLSIWSGNQQTSTQFLLMVSLT